MPATVDISAIRDRHAKGMPIAQIARELGYSRVTVRKHVGVVIPSDASSRELIDRVILPDALQTVHKAILNGNASVALRVVEGSNVLSTGKTQAKDHTLSSAVNTIVNVGVSVQPTPITPNSPSTDALDVIVEPVLTALPVDPVPTEAAAKAPGVIGSVGMQPQNLPLLESPQNFSQFSTAELERELERRRGIISDGR